MNRLDRYIFREIFAVTFVAVCAYTGFMLIRGLVQLSDLLLQSADPLRNAALAIAFSLPHIAVLTLPIGFLLGLLVGFGRLSADSELTAIRAAGVDLLRLYRPVAVLAVAITGIVLFLMLQVVPLTNSLLYTLRLRLSSFVILQRIQPGVFTPEVAGIRIFVEGASLDRKRLERLIVSDRSNPDEGERLTFAERGALESDDELGKLWLRVENAVTHHIQADPSRYDRTSYAVQRILLVDTDPKQLARSDRALKQLREQTLQELLATARAKRHPAEVRLAMVEVHKKFSFPAACLAFGLIGLPLGVVTRRGGRAAGFAVSVGLVLGYYVLFAEGEARAIEGRWTPAFAMWLPNLLLALLGAWAIIRVRKDRPILPRFLDLVPRRNSPVATPDEPSQQRRRPRFNLRPRAFLLDRYLTGRFLGVFVLVMASVLGLYVLIDYLEISDEIAKNAIPVDVVSRYYQHVIFPILLDVVPIAFLVAALIAVAGLVRSSETTAMLACGVSLYRATASLLVLAVTSGGILFVLADRVVPRAAIEAERLRDTILRRPQSPVTNAWFRGEQGRFFRVETLDASSRVLTRPSILELDANQFRLVSRTEGTRGSVLQGRGIVLEDGWTRSFGPNGETLFVRRPGRFLVPAPEASRVVQAGRLQPRQMTFRELSRFIEARRLAGATVTGLRTGLFQKTAQPVSVLLLTLVGLPFAFRFGRRGAVAGIGIAILLGLSYLLLSVLLVRFGERGSLPPLLAAWGTNVGFGLMAAHGLLGVRT